jgi:periplasmic protein TonB
MLNLSGRESTTPSRAPFGLSAALHLVAGLALIYLTQADTTPPRRLFRAPASTLVYVPVMPVEIPAIKLAELRAPVPVVAEEPAPSRPTPEIAPVFENRRAEVLKPVELPVEPPPAPAPTPPAPRRPEVTVGTFANAAAPVARTPEPARQIEIAGFDRVTNQTAAPKPAETTVGAFDRAVTGDARPQSSPQTVVADAGFNRSATVNSTAPEGRVIRDTGFGNTNSREKPRVAEPAQIAEVTFDNERVRQPATRAEAPPPQPRVTPVEVLFKPTPTYTEEARKLRIEGAVLLDVEFSSSGGIRVLRVVRGLGYGLDESAIKAAEQIKFKPAQESGRSVDSRATVNIVFRLA